MLPERVISSQRIFQGRALGLRVDTVEMASGRRTTREVVEHGDSVVIVALDGQGNVLLVRQFREAVGQTLLELPAGGVEPGESLDDSVRRELQEETGYRPQEVKKLGGYYSSPGFCTEYLHLFLATGLEKSPLQAEDTESIEVARLPLPQIAQLIASGQIADAKSVAGLLLALSQGHSLKTI